jgi:hypothetical protein
MEDLFSQRGVILVLGRGTEVCKCPPIAPTPKIVVFILDPWFRDR